MNTKPGLIPALEGLRGVSILLVMLSHAWMEHLIPGGLGVTIFFFISGFIITRTLLIEQEKVGRIDVSGFYIRRLFRLGPALLVFVFVACLVVYSVDRVIPWADVAAVLFYYVNYWDIAGLLYQGELGSTLSITWSLAVEQHYYLLFPFVFIGLTKVQPKLAIAMLVLVCALVLGWRDVLYPALGLSDSSAYGYRIYKASDTRIDSIVFGVIASWIAWYYPRVFQKMCRPVWMVAGVALLVFTLLYRDAEFREVLRYTLQGGALLLLFSWTILGSTFGSKMLSQSWLLYIGKISYSLYLYHWLVLLLLDHYALHLSLGARVSLLLLGSILLSDLSWRWVEQSGLKLRKLTLKRS